MSSYQTDDQYAEINPVSSVCHLSLTYKADFCWEHLTFENSLQVVGYAPQVWPPRPPILGETDVELWLRH